MLSTNNKQDKKNTVDWKELFQEKSVWIMFFLGFSAGLPILLVFGTLSNWLNEAGVNKSTITFFSWAGLGYGFKFIWAPLIDHIRLPMLTGYLGKRRSWLLLCQISLLLILVGMAMTDPSKGNGLTTMALLAVSLGFASASQDIVIDAYRIEITPPRFLGLSASTYTFGYRIGMIFAGAFALIISDQFGSSKENYLYSAWQTTFLIMASLMLIGIATTFFVSEPKNIKPALDKRGSKELMILFIILLVPFIAVYYYWKAVTGWFFNVSELGPLAKFVLAILRFLVAVCACFITARVIISMQFVSTKVATTAYWQPIKEFITRYPLKTIVLILLLIGFYRISDMVLASVANLFYQDIGFSKTEFGTASKFFGIWMTILGVFIGGYLIITFGTMKILMLGAILAAATNLLFMLLAINDNQLWLLYLVISADNLAAGIATAAFLSFLSHLSNIRFTAMQYAIFSSLMTLFPRLLGGYSGSIVEVTSYESFFLITTLSGIPVIFLISLVNKNLTLDIK